MKRILIDTQIWIYALKVPLFEEHELSSEMKKALGFIHRALRQKNIILFSQQLAAEIFHILPRRGRRLDPAIAEGHLRQLLRRRETKWAGTHKRHVVEALRLSRESDIHVWDFLTVLPFKGTIDIIYSNDEHFTQPLLKGSSELINPVGSWRKF